MVNEGKREKTKAAVGRDERKVYIISQVVEPPVRVASGVMVTSDSTKKPTDRKPANIVPITQSVAEIGFDAFAANIDSTTETLSELFDTAFAKTFGDYELSELEIDLEISADGKVGFMGSGIGLKGSSSIKLKFKKKP
jgi:hypothetical protein